jgi:hypothetical protein
MLAQGLHPAIAVVAANALSRAAAISGVMTTRGCKILHASDIDDELKRAGIEAVEQHEASVQEKMAKVAEAQRALLEASDTAGKAARSTSVAMSDLSRFDELAGRLAANEQQYESAVQADAEAARSLAAALGELDKILAQRQSASTSLEEARNSGDSRGGVPEAVIQQALHLQSALAKAETDKHEAVEDADTISHATGVARREARLALQAAHSALQAGMALISSGAPDWGPGVPLPGLAASYHDCLADSEYAAHAAESVAQDVEAAADSHLEQEQADLDALVTAGPVVLVPQTTVANWTASDYFYRDDAIFADEAFGRFGPEGVAGLITGLAGRGCQVIYLTDDADVLGWAIGLPHEAGGASTISNSRARRPVLVGD